jgi:hypothetical protein
MVMRGHVYARNFQPSNDVSALEAACADISSADFIYFLDDKLNLN